MERIEEKHYFKTHEEFLNAFRQAVGKNITKAKENNAFSYLIGPLHRIKMIVESYCDTKLLEGLYKDNEGNEFSELLYDVNLYFMVREAMGRADEEENAAAHEVLGYAKNGVEESIIHDVRAGSDEHADDALAHVLYSMFVAYAYNV